jgi:hypothetical protein
MATRALIINEDARTLIAAAIERARSHPLPLDVAMRVALPDHKGPTLRLAERRPDMPERPLPECLELYDGYRCAFSFEQQPSGMVRHLSIAVNAHGLVPMPAAVQMISKEYGFREFPPVYGRVWVEEYRPGEYAVNVAELVEIPGKPTLQ